MTRVIACAAAGSCVILAASWLSGLAADKSPKSDPARSANKLAQEATIRAQNAELEANLASQPARFSNIRVFTALSRATGEQLPEDVSAWWQWWQDYNQYHWPQQTYVTYSTQQSR